ncbi:hypothetical protein LGK97_16620 [Clostridium sp. CS001]|uniref:hypothetical protein n=1 Tax=Clostridium sp. CS001 TaxID=2880648 RepID=UPI001CF3A583|nr:hypothetical protein [Clostridium sp. CS001]MCB2291352.1 hypothetical protein [Clostridium sp. CS001]
MAKKIAIFITVIMFIVFLIPKVGQYKRYRDKENIKNLVINNIEFLNECIENENYDKILELAEVKENHFWKNDSDGIIVEYFCKGYGIVPAGLYTGFYYTSVDEPTGFQGVTHNLTKTKNGWEWKELNGDNFDYTEKITDYWYYYKAGF